MTERKSWYAELLDELGLTVGGRVAFTVVAALGIAGAIGNIVLNDEGLGAQAAAVLLIFVSLILAAVVGIDAAFRLLRRGARNLAGRSR